MADEPADDPDRPQRRFTEVSQQDLGAGHWVPNPAAPTSLRDEKGNDIQLTSFAGKNVILSFYPGKDCAACLTQLKTLAGRNKELDELQTVVVAIGGDETRDFAAALGESAAGIFLSTDSGFETAKSFRVYDDFEDKPISATVLLDKKGRVYWKRAGYEPLTNFDFLLDQIRYLNNTVQGPGGLLDR